MNGSLSSAVTIQWTPPSPPPIRGYNVFFAATPVPSPHTFNINSNTASVIITVGYNTLYTVGVSSNSCDGLKTTNKTFFLGTMCENYT